MLPGFKINRFETSGNSPNKLYIYIQTSGIICYKVVLPNISLFLIISFYRALFLVSCEAVVFLYVASRSHSLDTPHSVQLLWKCDQPKAGTSGSLFALVFHYKSFLAEVTIAFLLHVDDIG